MFKKCQTNCQADKNLWVRNNVFYFMVELPRKNGKRRYLCKSLHTKNYYEAQERLKIMKQSMRTNNIEVKSYINVAQSIINQLNFVEYEEEVEVAGQVLLQRKKYISEQNDPALIERLIAIVGKLSTFTQQTLDDDDIKIIKEIINISVAAQIQEVYKKGVVKSKTPPAGALTIEKVMIYMLNKVNNVQKVRIKREKRIEKMMSWVGLKLTDQYSKFYKADIIDKICEKIKKLDIKSGVKRTYTLDLKGLIRYANVLDSEAYNVNLIEIIPDFPKTAKADTNPHWPYTQDELKQIFNVSSDYFKKHTDVFWTTLIGLFVGARTNAAMTLQYGDIINEKGIDCFKFQDTHDIKELKNSATHRSVPIPAQLLDIGFVDYVKRRQHKLKAKDTDFIFPRCITSGGNVNNKFTSRGIIKYVEILGIQAKNSHKLDFHSFRKNASDCLEMAGVPETFINDICGWEGKNTRQQNYVHHDVSRIKEYADKMRYDFLQPEFDYWKEVMSKI